MEADTKTFWEKVAEALYRVVALAVFAFADRGLQIVLEWTVFKSGGRFLEFIDNFGNTAFGVLYVYLLWDMLTVFIPILSPAAQSFAKDNQDDEPEKSISQGA